MKKLTVIEILDSFEDEFDTEKFIGRLFSIESVEKGLKDFQEGKVYNYEHVKEFYSDKRLK
jgi:hypothetical protein